MSDEIASGAMQKLIGVNKVALNDLAKRGIVKRGERKGTYALQASVSGYCEHLRSMAAGRGGEAGASARERLGAAQADLWRTKLKAFRNRILAIPSRVEYLSARQTVVLTQELRAALTELADQ
jgi:phage terminase Nu1 subunit (DNA packaging protein)